MSIIQRAQAIPMATRGRIYITITAVLAAAVAHGLLTESAALLWAGVGSAVLGNGLAVINAHTARRWIYGIALATQPLVAYAGLASEGQAALWVGVVAAVLGMTTAVATTPPWPDWIGDEGN